MEAGCRKSFWEPQLVRSTIAFKEEAMLAVSVEGFRSLIWQLSVHACRRRMIHEV
jgi:hypothetical protein